MSPVHYLVFGDLHGRILPAFRLAIAWARDYRTPIAGLLQVGDLGYFPDPARLDRATDRHAEADPLELGVGLVTGPSPEAEAVFAGPEPAPEGLWFTAGNHEDLAALAERLDRAGGTTPGVPVDVYGRDHVIRDGVVATLPGGLRVGALWGVDGAEPGALRRVPSEGRIRAAAAAQLADARFDVLLTHEAPRGAILAGAGSAAIGETIARARPAFAFFGHYGGRGRRIENPGGLTQVYHLGGFERRREGACAEGGSVGVLAWDGRAGSFDYLDERWLRGFTRHNWWYR